MRSFKDANGREWNLSLNARSVWRVNDATKVHLPGLLGESADGVRGYVEFLGDDMKRAAVLWHMVKPQAEKLRVSEQDFLESVDGDTLESGTMMLQEELIDFFPNARREPLRKLLAKMEMMGQAIMTKAMGKVDGLGQKEIDEAFNNLLGKSIAPSGGSPGSSESIPDATLGDSST